jgi:Domain of unknown function (DUF5753)
MAANNAGDPAKHFGALYRLVGSPEVMAGQMTHLIKVARSPCVTMQVLPAIGHPAMPSGFMITDGAAYVEHVTGGLVHTEAETIERLDLLFESIRAESYRASGRAAVIRKAEQLWTGERAAIAPTAEPLA